MLTRESLEDDRWFAAWRARELGSVDATGITYLDYTGAALPSGAVLEGDLLRLRHGILGNPHSHHAPSRAASDAVARARAAILDFLHTDPDTYQVILTANASAACRLVAEGWDWGADRPLILSADNHNSVQGLREPARRAGSVLHGVPLDATLRLLEPHRVFAAARDRGRGLFAFPAQSNFSGVRHPLSLVQDAQSMGHDVLLDAAALLHSAPLDLSVVQPEFVVLSHYKIAGYPTGVGALVVRRDALERLQRPWFAGGTVEWVGVSSTRHLLRAGVEGFEDGTPAFQQVGAVPDGLAQLRRDGGHRLARHLGVLTGSLLDGLAALRHPNGGPMVRRYGPATTRDRGATIACNLLDAHGAVISFDLVERLAAANGLALRGGCFCNPGCAERAFEWPAQAVEVADGMGRAFTIPAFAAALPGYAVGAVRISLGLGSLHADVERALRVLEEIAGRGIVALAA
jgi:selenocysteine lyase/cysteine desulfurase